MPIKIDESAPFADGGEPCAADRQACHCSGHCDHGAAGRSEEELWRGAVENAVARAVFPSPIARRTLIGALGKAALLAAISEVLPLANATEAFAADTPAEIRGVKLGFIPITCATPLILAGAMGIYPKYGLRVELVKTPGWAVIRERAFSREYDAAHMLAPMPLAMTLGLGGPAAPFTMPAVENINGQAITLHIKHKLKRKPAVWKGFKFGVPFEYSMHNYLLRYYLAEHGVDPDKDVKIVAVPPPQSVAKLTGGELDGFLMPDPFNQRAVHDNVGFIHLLSKDIWDGHPCCVFAVSRQFASYRPFATKALLKAIIETTAYVKQAANRKQAAEFIAAEPYLNQPAKVVEQVLTGKFTDGLGNERDVPNRIDFDPFPWRSFAVWILTQMKRWGQIKEEVDYAQIAEQVYRSTETEKLMKEFKLAPPPSVYKTFAVMGKEFDPEKPDEYLASFSIKRSA
ncbi:MAG: CmpA/NrtA family ABC transporter substrate-binding protein [Rhodomicrobium sp.]